jgi:hypothetical protein
MDELIEAIAAVIATKNTYTIYMDDIPQDFERPSFFVYRISDLDTPMNRWTYNTNAIIQIVYFSPLDDYENIISKADQTATIKAIKHAFMATMGIKFGDSFAHLDKTNTDYTGNKDIFLQLTFNITNGTRKEYDEAQNLQTMQEINFNIKE